MHVEEYGLKKKEGVQIGVGTLKSGLAVVMYAVKEGQEVNSFSSDRFIVVSTIGAERILEALENEEDISSVLSSFSSDLSFASVSLFDKSSVIGRKRGERIEVWRYNAFDGFGHVLSDDSDPVVLDWADDFSSFSNKLWSYLGEYKELVINLEGGKRVFKR